MIYQPTYTLAYDCPMGMRITDMPSYRLYTAGGMGGEWRGKYDVITRWPRKDVEYLIANVVNGPMEVAAAAVHLGRPYSAVNNKLYRMRKIVREGRT